MRLTGLLSEQLPARFSTLAGVHRTRVRVPPEVVTGMLLVCAGYYLGSQIGFLLRLPPTTPSVLWPPNAILTAALLLTPARRWALYLLAALPAHLLAQRGTGWPAAMILGLFLTNCSEAVLGAFLARRLGGRIVAFDTLRAALGFVVGAVVLGPFLSSFLDAAVVASFRHEPYWGLWAIRFPSNVLTELVLVPALVTVVRHRMRWIRAASPRRLREALLLVAATVAVNLLVFTASRDLHSVMPALQRAPSALLLPLLVWAAVRFGPGGASLSLLAATLVAIWGGTRGLGLFAALPVNEAVRGLQVLLTATATPLLCLAALIEERRSAQEALAARLRFEELLSRVAGALLQQTDDMHAALRSSLERLGQFLGVDGVLLLEASGEPDELATTCSWTAPPGAPQPALSPEDQVGLAAALRGDGPYVSSAALALPVLARGRLLGALAVLSLRPRTWSEHVFAQLRVVSEIVANALARRRSEEALRASETMKSAILSSLTSQVAVLDRQGRVIALNDTWGRVLRETWGGGPAEPQVPGDYLRLCRNSNQPASRGDLLGIQAVLDGARRSFAAERSTRTPAGEERWYAVTAVPLNRPEGGAVVSHTDVTERRHAEIEAQRSREQLAHLLRVSTMGEMTTSLAHELNQPLTAILANAQAARLLLSTARPDLDEVRSILADMIDEDKRAGEIIRRLRELLKKGQRETVRLDLNALVEGVARIVSSDAVIRNITVQLDLHPEPLTVSADRVQIQQVLLNLMLNAMEAMVDSPRERTLVVRSLRTPDGTAQVEVEDTGRGFPETLREAIFQPFYTTKPTGMGMGLAIARSIVEAHGGRIGAANNPTAGATFHLALPLAAA